MAVSSEKSLRIYEVPNGNHRETEDGSRVSINDIREESDHDEVLEDGKK